MGKKKESKHPSFLRSVFWFFALVASKDGDEHCKTTGPEAAMIAASKHFSSAHKVRFD